MMKIVGGGLLLTLIVAAMSPTGAEARMRHHSRGHGSCDGIHGCRCGSTQTSYFGLPRNYNGHNLWRAVEWVHAFRRTTPAPGTVLYQHGGGPSGHVSRIVSLKSACRAIVSDDKGEYERDICSRGPIALAVR